MSRFPLFDASPGVVGTVTFAAVALLPLAVACGTDEDDAESTTSTAPSSPAMGSPTAGNGVRPPASSPGAAAGAAPPAAERPSVPTAPPASTPDGAPGQAMSAGSGSGGTAPAQLAFEACTYSEGTYGRNCDSIYVTMKQMSPARCVQLTIDNCGEYGRGGLPVDVPMPWRLDSATVGSNLTECELGVFYPSSSVAVPATGEISWPDTNRLPTELALDVTLEMSSAAPDSVDVVTAEPIVLGVCDE